MFFAWNLSLLYYARIYLNYGRFGIRFTRETLSLVLMAQTRRSQTIIKYGVGSVAAFHHNGYIYIFILFDLIFVIPALILECWNVVWFGESHKQIKTNISFSCFCMYLFVCVCGDIGAMFSTSTILDCRCLFFSWKMLYINFESHF